MSEEEEPVLDSNLADLSSSKWKGSPETEEEVLMMMRQCGLPTELRANDAKLEEFYMIGYNNYKAGRFKEAAPFFHILIYARPKEAKFMMAIAACYHMMKDYQQATGWYTLTTFLDPKDPRPYYHIADCWLKVGEPMAAFLALETGMDVAAKSEKYNSLRDRMSAMHSNLEHEFDEKKKMGVTNFRGPADQDLIQKIKKEYNVPDDISKIDQMISPKKKINVFVPEGTEIPEESAEEASSEEIEEPDELEEDYEELEEEPIEFTEEEPSEEELSEEELSEEESS